LMELLAPGLAVWRNQPYGEVDDEFVLDLWRERYESDRQTKWTGNPKDGPVAGHEAAHGPLRCRNIPPSGGLIRGNKYDDFTLMLQEDLFACLSDYAYKYRTLHLDLGWQETHRLLYYYPGAAMGPHSDNTPTRFKDAHGADAFDPVAPSRVLCTLQFLTTDEKDFIGGELYFPFLDVEYRPSKGDTLIYPANFLHTHGVQAVLDGIRITNLSCFCQGDFTKFAWVDQGGGGGRDSDSNIPMQGGNMHIEHEDLGERLKFKWRSYANS
jgi:hypothetical protein